MNFLDNILDLFKKKPTSSSVAKDRLKFLLVSDRATCSPEIMEKIKNDIIEVISKYMDIDTEALDIQIKNSAEDGEEGGPAFLANIPIKNLKTKQQ